MSGKITSRWLRAAAAGATLIVETQTLVAHADTGHKGLVPGVTCLEFYVVDPVVYNRFQMLPPPDLSPVDFSSL